MRIYLYEIRQQKHMTLQQLSEISGISKSEINYIENGKKIPKIDVVCKLAKALEVKVWDIFDCEEENF